MIMSIYMYAPLFVWAVLIALLVSYKLENEYDDIMEELSMREAVGEM